MINTCKQIVIKKISEISPYENNPRFNDKTVEALCKIIPKVGFNVPLYVDKNGVIIKGHARFKAAQQLGMTELPCIISENDDEQNKLDRISDNKISELSEWDLQDLRYELEQIEDFDLTDIGFELPKENFMEVEYAQEEFEDYSVKNFQQAKAKILEKHNASAKVTEDEFAEPQITQYDKPQNSEFETQFEKNEVDKPNAVLVKNGVPMQDYFPPKMEEPQKVTPVNKSEEIHNQMYDMQTPRTFIPLSTYGKGVKQQWYVKEIKNGVEQRYMKAICDCCGEDVIVFLK